MDQLAEQTRRLSPYVYGNNNPIRFIDTDGRLSKDFVDDLLKKSQNGSTWTNQGDGSFSDGNGNTVQEQGGDQDDPKKKKLSPEEVDRLNKESLQWQNGVLRKFNEGLLWTRMLFSGFGGENR